MVPNYHENSSYLGSQGIHASSALEGNTTVEENTSITDLTQADGTRDVGANIDEMFDYFQTHVNEEDTKNNDDAEAANEGGANNEEQITEEDIAMFRHNESINQAISLSQEGESMHAPRIDQVFENPEEAYKFYNEYSLMVGFSVVKSGNYHSKSKKCFGKVTRHIFRCNKCGLTDEQKQEKQLKKGVQTSKKRNVKKVPDTSKSAAPKKRTKVNVVTGCPAEMVITWENNAWTVTRLNLEHNHALVAPELSKLLRSHRQFTKEEVKMIRTFISVNIPDRKIIACLSFLRGGVGLGNYTKKDISNMRCRMRREDGDNDMTKVREFFTNRQAEDPLFFFTFDMDGENRVRNMFWSHASSRRDYDLYGDILSFDTTYQTNRYNLKFAPFVGINRHGQDVLFGGALIADETTKTFVWLFRMFLKCMGGRAPMTIVTDQDAAMKAAIAKELPQTVHRNSMFHVLRKAELNCGQTFANKGREFTRNFYDIIYNCLTKKEFEDLWNHMMEQFNMGHIRYFQHMYKTRKKYLPVY